MNIASNVYLSKSNLADPNLLSKVRKWLVDKGYRVIEHSGGTYDNSLLFQAQTMVMIPPSENYTYCNTSTIGKLNIGRGQYTQLLDRRTKGFDVNGVITDFLNNEPVIKPVLKDGVVNKDNWTDGYGRILIKRRSTIYLADISLPFGPGNNDSLPCPIENPFELTDAARDKLADNTGKWLVQQKSTTHLACINLFK